MLAAGVAAVYWASLPHTVQTLDSGDLVTSAWGLTVPHAPGYPLYVWLYHAFMAVLPVDTVFFRATLLTSLCMAGAVLLALRLCTNWLGVSAVAAMATLPGIWRYAVLPDVFALHILLSAAVATVAFERPTPWRIPMMALAFGLGAANHHSIIFLLPLVVLVAIEDTHRVRAAAILLAGAALAVGLYASLMLLDVEHINSFGQLSHVRGLLNHILRRDYGTFKLAPYSGTASVASAMQNLAAAVGAYGVAALVVVVVGAVGAFRERAVTKRRAWWVLCACLLAYLAVFVPSLDLGSTYLDGGLVFERFMLFPVLLMTLLVATATLSALPQPWLRQGVTAVLGLIAVFELATGDTFGMRNDVVVEEYARNLLRTAVRQTPAILMVDSDTKIFASRYVQATEPGFEDVFITSRSMSFNWLLLQRAQKRWPALYYDKEATRSTENRDIYAQFFAPNMEHFAITHVMPFNSPRGKTTVYSLGRGLEGGSGYVIADDDRLTPTPPTYRAADGAYVDTKGVFAEYATYYIAKAKTLLAQGDRDGARYAYLAGLERVPYCIPCLRGACELDPSQECNEALTTLERTEYDYFK